MKSKIMKQKETETVFSRRNYIILLISAAHPAAHPPM